MSKRTAIDYDTQEVLGISCEELKPWAVHTFSWGTAVKHEKGEWDSIFIGEIKIDVSTLVVEIRDAGILIKGVINNE